MTAPRIKVGDTAQITQQIKDTDVQVFADVTGDHNPLHLDMGYAKNTIFGRRIVHGMLVASMISNVIGNKLPGKGSVYSKQTLRFIRPVYIDDVITARVVIAKMSPHVMGGAVIQILASKVELTTECFNQKEELVIAGTAEVLI